MTDDLKTHDTGYVFRDASRPTLIAGSYTLATEWKVSVDQKEQEKGSDRIDFWVGAERFSIKPADIQSVYPPEGSRGDYKNHFPHIALTRDTLPWERSADKQEAPWLALLLLTDQEEAECRLRTIPLSEYRGRLPVSCEFVREPGQEDSDQVQALELSSDLIRALLPDLRELPLLCHVRAKQGDGDPTESVSVVVGKRLPHPGRNTLHLVSLENRYHNGSFDTGGQPKCLLISLKKWTFHCEETSRSEAELLDALFSRLEAGWLRLPRRDIEKSRILEGQIYASLGMVPLPHKFRTGETGASWYSGPLIPGGFKTSPGDLLRLPAQSADSLLIYDDTIGMLNVSYAAAWELGRLLVMQNRRILTSLRNWRRQQIRRAHAREAFSKCPHLPQVQRACPGDDSMPPAELTAWLNSLRQLQSIPFKYLVADERMAPPETIRFFSVDQQWVNSLLDGALSVARFPTGHVKHCEEAERALLNSSPSRKSTGFLLRSGAVSGWPGLVVSSYGADQKPLKLYRQGQPSPSTLLYLFEGELATVAIQQRPETLHLSLENHGTGIPAQPVWKDEERRVIHITGDSASSFAMTWLHRLQKLQISILSFAKTS
jgi:hypothetical protein